MTFAFTKDDFERYVKKGEHGGTHIWDEILVLLKEAYGFDFESAAFEKRGDNLKTIWFHPKAGPRQYWSNQAHFFLKRSIPEKTLTFGLMIEWPTPEMVQTQGLDPDLDALRFERQLAEDAQFQELFDRMVSQQGWEVVLDDWQSGALTGAADRDELLRLIRSKADSGYGVHIRRRLSADEAIAEGTDIAAVVVRAFREAHPAWVALLSETVRAYVENRPVAEKWWQNMAEEKGYWWVNQGQTFDAARAGGYIWAPQKNENGQEFFHWTNVSKVKAGDTIFHYASGVLRAVSVAKRDARAAERPEGLEDAGWETNGWRADLDYQDLPAPVPLEAVAGSLRALGLHQGPINSVNGVNQGYLYALSPEAARILLEKIGLRPSVVPAATATSSPKNQILYGPPGTGKTYITTRKAVEICDGKADEDQAALKARFRELRAQNRIAFVTFHQSYGYEDFVEGIRPVLADDLQRDGNADGGIHYECRDGIFKKMCALAKTSGAAKSAGDVDLNPDVPIWKMSLGDKQDPDQTFAYGECIRNKYILLGYGQNLDFSACTTRQAVADKIRTVDSDATNSDYSVRSVNSFRNEMKPGDLVVVTDGTASIRAIARVTGDYEYLDADRPYYHQKRTVEWLAVFDEPIPRERILTKKLARMTLYRFDPDSVNFEALTSLFSKTDAGRPDNYVLIIDEINRGNISKILGELITLLEEDKRLGADNEVRVTLPYSGDEFGVPGNLYVIGTMNTADRSIAFMDTALRRRFEFQEMMPDSGVVRKHVGQNGIVEGVDVAGIMDEINRRIETLYDRDHQIGHSCFLGIRNLRDLQRAFVVRVIPLLQEYFYEDWSKLCLILGCPYNPETGKLSVRNPNPIIKGWLAKASSVGGSDDTDFEDKLCFQVNPDFVGAKDGILKPFFVNIRSTSPTGKSSGADEEDSQ